MNNQFTLNLLDKQRVFQIKIILVKIELTVTLLSPRKRQREKR